MTNGLPISLSSVSSASAISLKRIFVFFREFTHYIYKLVNLCSSEKNSVQNALMTENCKIDLVLSDIVSKSTSYIVNTILSDKPYISEDILPKVHEKCKFFSEDILIDVEGTDLNHYKKTRIRII